MARVVLGWAGVLVLGWANHEVALNGASAEEGSSPSRVVQKRLHPWTHRLGVLGLQGNARTRHVVLARFMKNDRNGAHWG